VRAALEAFARRWWAGELGAGGRALSVLAAPLSWTWSGAAALAGRRRLSGAVRVEGLGVVSVGNLAVGGTGKTPLVGWIVSRLREAGTAPAVVVGARGRDEALLHERHLAGVPVMVDRDRVAACRRARAMGANVVVLDDGFQHRRLRRDLDVVLLSVEDSFPGRVLPCGPYREGPAGLGRANAVLLTRRTATADALRRMAQQTDTWAPGCVIGAVELASSGWTDLAGRPAEAPDGDVLAVCGVARPHAFRAAVGLRVRGAVELVAFEDHHDYTPADLVRIRERARRRPIVITEKDAVKLRPLAGPDAAIRVLVEEVRWDWGEDAFRSKLREVLARSGA
jgi:tetraacyldisaccharide 4'-kinase